MTARRAQIYDAVDASSLLFGVNSNSHLTAADLDAAVDLGAKIVRIHPGWNGVENYTTGVLALPAATVTALELMAERNLTPMIVCGYGPPWTTLTTVTVASLAAAGTTTVTVNESIAAVDVPYCHLGKAGSVNITNHPSNPHYYGSFITAVNTGTKTLTLAAPLNADLTAGTSLLINRLRYPTIATSDPAESSTQAFTRYLTFVASEIDRICGGGYVCLWNEAPWVHDAWLNRDRFYSPTAPGTGNDTGLGLLKAVVYADIPSSVEIINGCSDKTGGASGVNRGVYSDPETQVPILAWDGIHPYGANPESHGHYTDQTDAIYGAGWQQTISPIYQTSNFRWAYRQHTLFRTTHGVAPRLAATECGYYTDGVVDESKKAEYLVRRIVSLWGMGVPMVVLYALAEGGVFRLCDPGGVNHSQAFIAIARMFSLLPTGSATVKPPTVLGTSSYPVDTMTVPIVGTTGATVIAWQRTEHATVWESTPTPAPATLTLSDGSRLVDATNLINGDTVETTVTAGRVALTIGSQPVAVRFTA